MSFFRRRQFAHLNTISVSKERFVANHQQLLKLNGGRKVAPVLKSNAYGHGLELIGQIVDELKPPFMVVDSLYEAYRLQKLKLSTPILIMGYTNPENLRHKRLPFQFSVFDLETAKALNSSQRNCGTHLFIDTGMHREGIVLSELDGFLVELKKLRNLKVVGVTSHFADADNSQSNAFTLQQIEVYKKALLQIKAAGFSPEWTHISASAGAMKITDPIFSLVRAGIASYGINPLDSEDAAYANISLEPVLRFISTLAQAKEIEVGESVGYGVTFTAEKKMKIGLVPAGYYDGVDRRLSSKGVMVVRGVSCPILGRVSMNMTTIDLSAVNDAKVGDEVEIYSANKTAANSIDQSAKLCGTIPYELLVHLSESIYRKVE